MTQRSIETFPRESVTTASHGIRGVRRLAVVTVGATLLLIAMGGAVRATDSGLACPDWPACHGTWIPPADLNMWLEHSHRLWAGVVGLLVAWLTVWTLLRFRSRPVLPVLSVVAALLVVIQAGLGAAVVLLHLRADLVTAHLGMSLVVVGCLVVIAVVARDQGAPAAADPAARRVGRWAAIVAGLVFLQALLGGQTTGRGGAYVFNAFPFWLSDDAWTGHVREVLHASHRAAGYLVAGAVIAVAVAARRIAASQPGAPRWLRYGPSVAAVLVVVQVLLGIANVLTRASVPSAIAHLTVASWLWVALVTVAALGLRHGSSAQGTVPPRSAGATRSPTSTATEEIRT